MHTEQLFDKVRARIAPTKEERIRLHRERSEAFNKKAEEDLERQRMTPDILAKRCTL